MKILELQNVRAALQDRVGMLETQIKEALAEATQQRTQVKEATAALAEERDARGLAENTAKSKAKRLQAELKRANAR